MDQYMLLPNEDDDYVELNDTAIKVTMTIEDCKICRIN